MLVVPEGYVLLRDAYNEVGRELFGGDWTDLGTAAEGDEDDKAAAARRNKAESAIQGRAIDGVIEVFLWVTDTGKLFPCPNQCWLAEPIDINWSSSTIEVVDRSINKAGWQTGSRVINETDVELLEEFLESQRSPIEGLVWHYRYRVLVRQAPAAAAAQPMSKASPRKSQLNSPCDMTCGDGVIIPEGYALLRDAYNEVGRELFGGDWTDLGIAAEGDEDDETAAARRNKAKSAILGRAIDGIIEVFLWVTDTGKLFRCPQECWLANPIKIDWLSSTLELVSHPIEEADWQTGPPVKKEFDDEVEKFSEERIEALAMASEALEKYMAMDDLPRGPDKPVSPIEGLEWQYRYRVLVRQASAAATAQPMSEASAREPVSVNGRSRDITETPEAVACQPLEADNQDNSEKAERLSKKPKYDEWERQQHELRFPKGAKKSVMNLRDAAQVIATREDVDVFYVERETRRVRREREKRGP